MKTFIWLSIIYVYSLQTIQSKPELIQSNVVFRHGDRSPSLVLPKNGLDPSVWIQGFKQLTQVGMRQTYGLGHFLRNRYKGFISDLYLRNETLVVASDKDRAIQSAESALAGLYPPTDRQTFKGSLQWQPIPVHTKAKGKDPITKPSGYNCPSLDKWREEKNDPKWDKIESEPENKKFQDFMRQATGITDFHLRKSNKINTLLKARAANGFPKPEWASPSVVEKLAHFAALKNIYKYDDDKEHVLAGGRLVGDIIERMKKAAKGEPVEILKIYSSHSGTVSPLLFNLGIYNGIPPPYAAALIIELLSDKDAVGKLKHTVRFLYRNESVEPSSTVLYDLQVPGCPTPCSLDQFIRVMKGKYYTHNNELEAACDRPNQCELELSVKKERGGKRESESSSKSSSKSSSQESSEDDDDDD